jgi:hypothetical protein
MHLPDTGKDHGQVRGKGLVFELGSQRRED